MHELTRQQMRIVLPLVETLDQAVLPRAVIEGTAPGWIFTDSLTRPETALIGLPCGYFFGAGKAPLDGALSVLDQIFIPRSQAAGNFGFLISFSGPDWQECLPFLLGDRNPIQIFRRSFTFDAALFELREQSLPPLPDGFTLRPLDAELLAGQPGLVQEILGTWSAPADFLQHGCGAAVLRGSELVSVCHAAFATAEHMEISVSTADAHRRQGFARRTCAAMIRRCLARGKQPNWVCFWDNDASTALAQSLGFVEPKDTAVFYWEEKPEPLGTDAMEPV